MTDERIPGWDNVEWYTLKDYGVTGGRSGVIVADCPQHNVDGTANREWLNIRKGCLGASSVHKIMGIKGEPSKSSTRDTYKYELIAQQITGELPDNYVSPAMQRGFDLEPDAREWYAAQFGPVRQVGFVRPEGASYGCSPDGLCADRGIEIKCRGAQEHCRYLDTGKIPIADRLQCQYSMWVTGLPLWDYIAFYPPGYGLPCRVVTLEADDALQSRLEAVVGEFMAEVAAAVEKIRA